MTPTGVPPKENLFHNQRRSKRTHNYMTNTDRIRVLSVDDHPLFREGIGAIINCQPDMSLVGAASNGKEAIEAFRALRPNVTLMDLRLPDLGGLDVMIAIRSEFVD